MKGQIAGFERVFAAVGRAEARRGRIDVSLLPEHPDSIEPRHTHLVVEVTGVQGHHVGGPVDGLEAGFGETIVVVSAEDQERHADLSLIRSTDQSSSAISRDFEAGEQERGQDHDHGEHHDELDDTEAGT